MKTVKTILATAMLLATVSLASAGDASVEANIEQDIDLTTVQLTSNDGTVDASIASLLAHDGSEVEADIESDISASTIKATTDNGVARLSLGSVEAGR